ncbi:hypothetical protein QCD60_19870 [Pokkaliibacter sp. MBI-7]|uniref:hypothetical protein n=1 Tax=Pokkaliibacter sp. MBI-7 TaxID=3040600 RepID=UPI00244BFF40|nr:hypothetical protein [Pokkaliibacter sp. MBI-7]MDH2434803.1 hypothetical protein [Pokkaliibacter sp. MBI-7]
MSAIASHTTVLTRLAHLDQRVNEAVLHAVRISGGAELVYERHLQAAYKGLLQNADPAEYEAIQAVLENEHGMEAEMPVVTDPRLCPETGIDKDYCSCGCYSLDGTDVVDDADDLNNIDDHHVIAQALDRMKQHLEAAQSYLDEGDTQQAQCWAYAAGEDAWEAMQAFPTALNLSPVLAAAFERSWHECERKHLSWVKGIAYEPEVNSAICLTPITV